MNAQSALTPPMFFNVSVIFLGFGPCLMGTFPKSHVNILRFFCKSWMLWLVLSELLNSFSLSFNGFLSSWFSVVSLNLSHRLEVLIWSFLMSVNRRRGKSPMAWILMNAFSIIVSCNFWVLVLMVCTSLLGLSLAVQTRWMSKSNLKVGLKVMITFFFDFALMMPFGVSNLKHSSRIYLI